MSEFSSCLKHGMPIRAQKTASGEAQRGRKKIWVDSHAKKFYEAAAKEYEICSQCPYSDCMHGCTPKTMKRKLAPAAKKGGAAL